MLRLLPLYSLGLALGYLNLPFPGVPAAWESAIYAGWQKEWKDEDVVVLRAILRDNPTEAARLRKTATVASFYPTGKEQPGVSTRFSVLGEWSEAQLLAKRGDDNGTVLFALKKGEISGVLSWPEEKTYGFYLAVDTRKRRAPFLKIQELKHIIRANVDEYREHTRFSAWLISPGPPSDETITSWYNDVAGAFEQH
ncbi:hypothetical protein RPPS3_13450 [Rhodopseudomonas palustris]|nr:hypothetical protein RPPS3_13450 [Rhodopseudomonas palustris]